MGKIYRNGIKYADSNGGESVRTGVVTLAASGWSGGSSHYSQSATLSGVSVGANHKIDLQTPPAAALQMLSDGTSAIFIENNNGTLTAHAIGEMPTANITLQYCITPTG